MLILELSDEFWIKRSVREKEKIYLLLITVQS